MPTGIRGPGEMGRKESYPPPTAMAYRRGGLEQCGNQEAVMEGQSGGLPSETAGTSPSEKVSQNVAASRGSFHDAGTRP